MSLVHSIYSRPVVSTWVARCFSGDTPTISKKYAIYSGVLLSIYDLPLVSKDNHSCNMHYLFCKFCQVANVNSAQIYNYAYSRTSLVRIRLIRIRLVRICG